MKCPVDNTPLMVVERDRVELDYCTVCKGIWFDAEELHMLAATLNKDIHIPEIQSCEKVKTTEKARKSPRTGKKMDKINMGSDSHPIIIDRDIDGHGLWFDRGELASVIENHLNADPQAEHHIIRFVGETIRI